MTCPQALILVVKQSEVLSCTIILRIYCRRSGRADRVYSSFIDRPYDHRRAYAGLRGDACRSLRCLHPARCDPFRSRGVQRKFTFILNTHHWFRTKGPSLLNLAIAMFPACLLGLVFHGFIKNTLFGPMTVIIGLVLGGIFMIAAEKCISISL